MLSLPAIP
ncbi:hypothetical protein D047_4466A, partial [Vibrio parahaemolyticus VPTS-2010_2]